MKLEYVPLLQIQRGLHEIPRGPARFEAYVRTMTSADGTDIALAPLVTMNPMAKDHVAALLDAYLAMDADGLGALAAAEASAMHAEEPGEFKAGLVVVDDLAGGWTNRYACEYDLRFPDPANKRFWVTGCLWSSEPASESTVREAVMLAAFRTAYVLRHGPARTLRDLLVQEGQTMVAVGCAGPELDPDDLEYTREVISTMLDRQDKRAAIECLFGDPAAHSLGLTPNGLTHNAGLALALHDARNRPQDRTFGNTAWA